MSQIVALEFIKCDLRPGEYSWEVMEHSDNVGEKPIRLVISPEGIRTLTSLLLKKPTEIKEHWKVSSNRIIKVSWCLELCVFSVLYYKQDDTKEYTKAFFVDQDKGKKIVKKYKKIKPVFVHLSPSRPKKTKKKGYQECHNKQEPQLLKSSFTLRVSEQDEKMWRATFLDGSAGEMREVFLGISPTAVRIVNPSSMGAEWQVDHLHLLGIKYQTRFPYTNILTLKYFTESIGKHPKSQSKCFHVLPVIAKDILSYFDQCNIHSLCTESKAIPPLTFNSLPDLVRPSVINGIATEEQASIPHSLSVPETNLDPNKSTTIITGSTTGMTGTNGSVGANFLVNDNKDKVVGQKLSKRVRPNSVKLPNHTLAELKDEPPRAASARRARPKSTYIPATLTPEEGVPNHTDIVTIKQSKPGVKLSASSAPPQPQPLSIVEPNLPDDNRRGCGKRHSRNKSHVEPPIRDSVCYYGKEGGIKRLVREALEGPRVTYE